MQIATQKLPHLDVVDVTHAHQKANLIAVIMIKMLYARMNAALYNIAKIFA